MHGMKDTLIPYEHSVQLNMVCPNLCFMNLVEHMDHNNFNLKNDLCTPLKKFLKQLDEQNMPCRGSSASVEIKNQFRQPEHCKYQLYVSKGKVIHSNLFDKTETEYYGGS